jgi:hypothetical protein
LGFFRTSSGPGLTFFESRLWGSDFPGAHRRTSARFSAVAAFPSLLVFFSGARVRQSGSIFVESLLPFSLPQECARVRLPSPAARRSRRFVFSRNHAAAGLGLRFLWSSRSAPPCVCFTATSFFPFLRRSSVPKWVGFPSAAARVPHPRLGPQARRRSMRAVLHHLREMCFPPHGLRVWAAAGQLRLQS